MQSNSAVTEIQTRRVVSAKGDRKELIRFIKKHEPNYSLSYLELHTPEHLQELAGMIERDLEIEERRKRKRNAWGMFTNK